MNTGAQPINEEQPVINNSIFSVMGLAWSKVKGVKGAYWGALGLLLSIVIAFNFLSLIINMFYV